MQNNLTLIVATDRRRGIGIRNTLPWKLPEDLAHFKRTTSGHAIIMGRKTFDSIGRPLPNRRNIVVTRNPVWQHEGVTVATSLPSAVALAAQDQVFVIGGAQIFVEALPIAQRLIVTEISAEFDSDVFFPPIDALHWKEVAREGYHSALNGFDYAFVTYERR
jgi:dihydrofolate reductase